MKTDEWLHRDQQYNLSQWYQGKFHFRGVQQTHADISENNQNTTGFTGEGKCGYNASPLKLITVIDKKIAIEMSKKAHVVLRNIYLALLINVLHEEAIRLLGNNWLRCKPVWYGAFALFTGDILWMHSCNLHNCWLRYISISDTISGSMRNPCYQSQLSVTWSSSISHGDLWNLQRAMARVWLLSPENKG